MPKRKNELGLGRGLNALLGDPDLQPKAEGTMTLPISQVEPTANQPRKRFDEEALADLTESIRIYGIIQPLTVRRLSTGYYQIIAGERRWRAAKSAGLTEVPVTIVEADDRKALELGLIENLQRTDLNPVEEARGYQSLIDLFGLSQEQVSQRVGKSRPSVANALRLLALPPDVLSMVEEEDLSPGHARALLPLENAEQESTTARTVVERQLSVRQTESLVRLILKRQGTPPRNADTEGNSSLNVHLEDLANRLSGNLGRKVRIQNRGKKGRVELEYYGAEDLETLLGMLEGLTGKEVPPDA